MKRSAHWLDVFLMFLILIFSNIGCTPTEEPTTTPTTTPTGVPTVTLTPTITPTPDPNYINILIMTRQHGDEHAGTSAIFSYINDLINNSAQYVFTNSNPMKSSDVEDEITKIKNINLSSLDIQISDIGTSVDGKPLHLIKIKRPLGQIGDDLLPANVMLLFVPIANPDGADLDTRNNNDPNVTTDGEPGANINRDWDALTEPETQAIHNNVFDVLSPEIVLDMHEFTAYRERRDVDMTYFRGVDDNSPASLTQLCTDFETVVDPNLDALLGSKFLKMATNIVTTWEKGNSTFGGSHFALKHYAINYTIETKGMPAGYSYVPPFSQRITMHRTFFQSMIKYAATNRAVIVSTIADLRAGN